MTTTQKKINLDSVTAQALFKAVTQVTNEINDTMIKDYQKRNNPLKLIAQASEFYVPTCLVSRIESLRPLKALIHSRIGQT
jgi:hypothetical protein